MGDWEVAEAHELAGVATGHGDADAASGRLGAARARDGVGIDEALDDLERLWALLGDAHAPGRVVRAFAAGWVDEAVVPAARPVLDPVTGLATADVLRMRVADLVRTGAAEACALVSVDVVDPGLPRFARHLEVAATGLLVAEAFAGAESPVRLPQDRVAAIVPRDDALDEGVVRLRRALDRRAPGRDPDGVRVAGLPDAERWIDAWLERR